MTEVSNSSNINHLLSSLDEANEKLWKHRTKDFQHVYKESLNTLLASRENNYSKGMAEALRNLGYACWRMSDYASSLEYSSEALDLFKRLNDKKGEADVLNSIGAVYAFQGENEKRLKCNLKCLELRKDFGDIDGYFSSLNNIGETYLELGQFDEAIEYFNLVITDDKANAGVRAWCYFNLGEIASRKNEKDASVDFLKTCLALAKQADYIILLIAAQLLLGKVYLKKNLQKESLQHLKDAFRLAEANKAREQQMESAEVISQVLEGIGDLKESLSFYKNFHQLHVELFSENNLQKLKSLELKYETEALQRENEVEKIKNFELKKAFTEIEIHRNQIAEKNKALTDSIRYAERIQHAVLPDGKFINSLFKDHFIFFQPKDIVSGDFFWFYSSGDYVIFACVDCTGHGVPGAFMSLIGNELLQHIVRDKSITSPADALKELDKQLRSAFSHSHSECEINDGMDIALCALNKKYNTLQFAGAQRPLLYLKEGNLIEIKGDKRSIGGYRSNETEFTNHELDCKNLTSLYLFTDGYPDQFGGGKGKKYKYKHFVSHLQEVSLLPFTNQKIAIENNFFNWKGEYEQVDDVCVIGIQL